MGGKASTSSTQTSSNINEETTISEVDNRVVEGETVNIGGAIDVFSGDDGGDVYVTSTDGGAIQGGLNIALQALDRGAEILKIGFESNADTSRETLALLEQVGAGSKDIIQDLNSSALQSVESLSELGADVTKSESAKATQDLIKYGVYAVLGLGGVLAVISIYKGK